MVILLDLSRHHWVGAADAKPPAGAAAAEAPVDLNQFLTQVLIFINSFLVSHQRNHLCVMAMTSSDCHVVYASAIERKARGEGDVTAVPAYLSAGTDIMRKLRELTATAQVEEKAEGEAGGTAPPFSAALARALCYLNRLAKSEDEVGGFPATPAQQRVLCMLGARDHPPQYISVMNAVFSAQRSGVVVDGYMLGQWDSAFLQQAANITGGVYLRPQQQQGLLQFLLSVFGVDQSLRESLVLPRPLGVDFRASCFCHKDTIDLGYVCSVCLSIFCQACKECSTCGTVFARRRAGGK
mmetsp:Transcript_41098/g.131480  ORF Transcript_41098/g.131480 Transcript_41098/m.131480 type:complete len:296 (-) Transcript_41098:17-904(-)